ncbi:MAG: adenylosuccinate lyase [Chitinophagaceae bacterium]|nr:adenylosuccinate lyase [Chitinophagaceae bacterium]
MDLTALTAISPIDGRYRNQLQHLDQYFSEFALMRYRILVEVEYLIRLSRKKFFDLQPSKIKSLRNLYQHFSPEKAMDIKEVEKTTNHDVKAVEYYIKKELDHLELEDIREWVHFGLTSQDINNTAIPLLWKESLENEYYPAVATLILTLKKLAANWKNIPMLAHTHGQPASPTRLGKEIMVFAERLLQQMELLQTIPNTCKFGGATGNFNAHYTAYPDINWIKFANDFCSKSLGLQRQQFTTQIEHYDHLAAQLDGIKRLNTILVDFCRDIWTYISMEYFKQKVKKGEVGSSAMPHKVNPIDFENAEGNLGLANAILEHLSAKLPVSRMQRDLTDSTVLRNLGVPFAHTVLALRSVEKGLGKLLLNESKIRQDLEQNWAVVAEAIQTVLRRENYPRPYEALKDLTRGVKTVDSKTINRFIDKLNISPALKKKLKAITPFNYLGKNPEW